jgi:hypothetical protein
VELDAPVRARAVIRDHRDREGLAQLPGTEGKRPRRRQGYDLDFYGFIRLIMLLGIVKKNAIMQVDFAIEAERSGKAREAAIYEGALVRLRPIMMTTVAASWGPCPSRSASGQAPT